MNYLLYFIQLPSSGSEAMTAYGLILTCSIITMPTPEAGQCLPKDKNGSLQPLENSRKFCVFLGLSNTSAQCLLSFIINAKPGNC